MAATRKRAPVRKPAARKPASRARARRNAKRRRDVLGLALVAVGIFMGFVLYGGWDGGRAGHGVALALGWTLGRARVLAPVALVIGGGVLLLRPVLPAVRPLRTGSI